MIPIPLNTLEKCVSTLKTHLSDNDRKTVNKFTNSVLEALDAPAGEVIIIFCKNPLISTALASYIYHVTLKMRKIGQKIIYTTAVEIFKQDLKISDANICIINNLELVDRFDMKKFLTKLNEFIGKGGICLIPTAITFDVMADEYGISVANTFFSGLFTQFKLGG